MPTKLGDRIMQEQTYEDEDEEEEIELEELETVDEGD